MLALGDPMPTFTAPDDTGRIRNSQEFIGKPLVLWFYPKDDTPG